MQERQVTIAHTTYPVPDPFLVMATQNPIESEGTYPLPEAQIDRFMLKILIDYPEHDEELTIVQRQLSAPPELREALSLEGLRELQRAVFEVYVDPPSSATPSPSRRRRASLPTSGSPSSASTSTSVPARAGRSASHKQRARSPSSAAATTRRPTT